LAYGIVWIIKSPKASGQKLKQGDLVEKLGTIGCLICNRSSVNLKFSVLHLLRSCSVIFIIHELKEIEKYYNFF
jgi:hypothetical protein